MGEERFFVAYCRACTSLFLARQGPGLPHSSTSWPVCRSLPRNPGICCAVQNPAPLPVSPSALLCRSGWHYSPSPVSAEGEPGASFAFVQRDPFWSRPLVAGQKGEKVVKSSADRTVEMQYKEKRHTHIKCSVQQFIDK